MALRAFPDLSPDSLTVLLDSRGFEMRRLKCGTEAKRTTQIAVEIRRVEGTQGWRRFDSIKKAAAFLHIDSSNLYRILSGIRALPSSISGIFEARIAADQSRRRRKPRNHLEVRYCGGEWRGFPSQPAAIVAYPTLKERYLHGFFHPSFASFEAEFVDGGAAAAPGPPPRKKPRRVDPPASAPAAGPRAVAPPGADADSSGEESENVTLAELLGPRPRHGPRAGLVQRFVVNASDADYAAAEPPREGEGELTLSL
jgi:hypothetical protein